METFENSTRTSMETKKDEEKDPTKKIKKPGVVYLNYIPRYMTVKTVRAYFSEFGEVRRIFLKPENDRKNGGQKASKKPSKFFCEGWIEFGKRRVAKEVAQALNGKQVGGKRRTKYYDALWSIKYLKNFQWSQLHEKLAYLKAKKQQRMRAEIAQIKREVDFFTKGVEKSKRLKRIMDAVTDKDANSEDSPTLQLTAETVPQENCQSIDTKRTKLMLGKIF